jgi:phosphatidylglycerol:prolipoprotein diacylglycerol transferase
MIPYFELKAVPLGPLRVPTFGILLATAILVGRWRVLHLERAEGRDDRHMAILCLVMLALGLTSAVVIRMATADFVALLTHPALALTERRGIMSVGGFYGGLVGGLIWCRLRRVSGFETLKMLDRIAFVLPFSWMIGRLGCALVHDHVGRASTSWLAVRFPSGGAYDLGVLEFLLLIPMSVLFEVLGRRPMPPGWFFGLFGVLYGGLRAWLETLQAYPVTWGPKAGVAGIVTGLAGWMAMAYQQRRGTRYRGARTPMIARG